MLLSKKNRSKCSYIQSTHSQQLIQSRLSPSASAMSHMGAGHEKNTEQQYHDIFKAISSNYFEKTAIGDYCRRKSGNGSIFDKYKSLGLDQAGDKKIKGKENQGIQRSRYQEQQWNQNRQINKLLKIAQNIQQIRGDSYSHPQTISQHCQSTLEQPPTRKLQPEISQKSFYNNKIPFQRVSRRYRKQHTETPIIHTAIHTPHQSHGYKSANPSTSPMLNYKFVRIHRKQTSKDVNLLKEAVAELQSIAVNKYGMTGFTSVGRNWQIEDQQQQEHNKDDQQIQIKDYCQFQNRLKQIRSVQCTKPKPKPDSSIPTTYMRALSAKRMPSYTHSSKKQKQSSIYIRV